MNVSAPTSPAQPKPDPVPAKQNALGAFAHRYALLIAWALTTALFGAIEPDSFLQFANFTSIFNSQAVQVVLTCSLVMTLTASDTICRQPRCCLCRRC